MTDQNQSSISTAAPGIETLQDIKRMMERSSRFISLSGLSGIAAGTLALIGAYFAYDWIHEYYVQYNGRGSYAGDDFTRLKLNLLGLAAAVLAASLVLAFYFTWRRARHNNLPVWDMTSRRLAINMIIPLAAGGAFILAMLQYNEWRWVAPSCLIFYGLALVNASKYTFTDVRYLGYLEIVLGLINTQYIGYGLYFWAMGFGVLHIIYGVIMWWKYERQKVKVKVKVEVKVEEYSAGRNPEGLTLIARMQAGELIRVAKRP